MRNFTCKCAPHSPLYFDSSQCLLCGSQVALDFERMQFERIDSESHEDKKGRRLCANGVQYGVCNWLVTESGKVKVSDKHKHKHKHKDNDNDKGNDEDEGLCVACALNRTVPNLSVAAHIPLWRKVEAAKRRVLYSLKQLRLWRHAQNISTTDLRFDILVDAEAGTHFRRPLPGEKVLTGHSDGLVTINLAEADEVALHEVRVAMDERYRTLLGTLRHEVGHYYWTLLIEGRPKRLKRFRKLFGDESSDYSEALDAHYARMEAGGFDWSGQYVSAYASCHPWEDWAETWAHLLHIIDTLDTASDCGLSLTDPSVHSNEKYNVGEAHLFDDIFDQWIHLSVILNMLNRSMGLMDAYPFVLPEPVKEKLNFVFELIGGKYTAPLAAKKSVAG